MADTVELQDIYDFLDNWESELMELAAERDELQKNIDIDQEVIEQYKGERDGYRKICDALQAKLDLVVEALEETKMRLLDDVTIEVVMDILRILDSLGANLAKLDAK